MEKKQLNGKDLLLSFLYSPGIGNEINEKIIGRTKLTKMMFLFEKQLYDSFFKDEIVSLPEFEPYYFGPFSKELFENLAFFESIGMIIASATNVPLSSADRVERNNVFDEYEDDEDGLSAKSVEYESAYTLSSVGKKYVQDNVWSSFSDTQKEKLKQFKAQINRISLDALLRYVYTMYPDQTEKSIIADKYI